MSCGAPVDDRGRALSRFGSDRRGVALVEFAIVLPFVLFLYLGSIQLTNALSCHRKVTAASRFIADYVSQTVVIEPNDLDAIFLTAQVIMQPYAPSGISVRVTSLTTDKNAVTRVVWSRAVRGAALRRGAEIVLPDDLIERGRSLIKVESWYDFKLLKVAGLPTTISLADDIYMAPRHSASVACKNCL